MLVVERGAPALLTCVNRAHVWTDRHLEEAQQVVHWDRQPPGVPHDRADRLLDLYASGERRAYGPDFLRDRVAVEGDAFARGDFSLRIAPLEPADEGTYSCHLHHHYCGLHERRVFHLEVTEPAAAPAPAEPPPRDSPGNGSSPGSVPAPGAGGRPGRLGNVWEPGTATRDLVSATGGPRGLWPPVPSPRSTWRSQNGSGGGVRRGRPRSELPDTPLHGPCRSHAGARPQRHQRHRPREPGPLLSAAGLRAGHAAALHPAAHHRRLGHAAPPQRRWASSEPPRGSEARPGKPPRPEEGPGVLRCGTWAEGRQRELGRAQTVPNTRLPSQVMSTRPGSRGSQRGECPSCGPGRQAWPHLQP